MQNDSRTLIDETDENGEISIDVKCGDEIFKEARSLNSSSSYDNDDLGAGVWLTVSASKAGFVEDSITIGIGCFERGRIIDSLF